MLPKKGIKYDIIQGNVYPLPVNKIYTVTPLYRRNYTTASKHDTSEYSRLIRYHMY